MGIKGGTVSVALPRALDALWQYPLVLEASQAQTHALHAWERSWVAAVLHGSCVQQSAGGGAPQLPHGRVADRNDDPKVELLHQAGHIQSIPS